MRIIAKGTLRDFWGKHPDSEAGLRHWFEKITEQGWANPNSVIEGFSGADTVRNGRIVFNIARNKYRLIVKFVYETQIGYIRFVGTHKEYDKIEDIQDI
jgi:mRNA interferase HigB